MSTPTDTRSILVIKLGALGDFIFAQPAFEAIRRHHAGDRLVLLTIPALAELGRRCGRFDDVWTDPRGRSPAAYWAVRRMIRGGGFARVYDLQTQKRTNRYFYSLFPGPWPEWSGTAWGCSHPDHTPDRRALPGPERYARQLAPLGITVAPWPDMGWLDADIGGFALPPGPFALLIPGSSPDRTDKRWPVDRYAALAERLADRGMTPVVLGGAGEADLAARIRAQCPQAVDLTGRTGLADIAGLARRAACAVGNDTGPTHLVGAVGTPSLVLLSDAFPIFQSVGRNAAPLYHPSFDTMDVDEVLAAVTLRMAAV